MRNKILQAIFLLGLFVSPFVFNPYSSLPFEIPKVWFVRVWIEILVILGIIFSAGQKSDNKTDKILTFSVLVFSVIAIITSISGVDVNKSWVGNYYRGDGLFTFFHFIVLFLLLKRYLKPDWIKNSVLVIAGSGILISLWSVLIWVLINVFGKYSIETWIDDGIGLAFGNPNFLVGYLILCLPLTAYFLNNFRFKYQNVFSVLVWTVLLAAIIFTNTRVGIFAIAIFLSLWMITSSFKYKYAAFFFAIILLIASVVLVYRSNFLDLEFQTPNAESRVRIYTKGLLAFREKPIYGFGWANFDHAFDSVAWPTFYEEDVYVDKAHSSILESAVTTGILGLVFYLIIIGRAGKILSTKASLLNRSLFVSFALLTIHMQINIVSISEELIFWILVSFASLQKVSHPKIT